MGFSHDEESNWVLVQQINRNQAHEAYRQAIWRVMRTATYWRRNLVITLLFIYWIVYLVRVAMVALPLDVLLIGCMMVFGWYETKIVADRLVGRTVTVFTSDGMVRKNQRNGTQVRLPYAEPIRLLVTSHAIVLYQPQYNSVCCYSREAFATPQEEAEFLELLKQRFTAIHSRE